MNIFHYMPNSHANIVKILNVCKNISTNLENDCNTRCHTFDRIQEFAALDADEQEAFEAFLDVTCDKNVSFDDFRERYCGEWDNEEAFAEHLVEELDMFHNVPESVSRFFNYKAFAHELLMSYYDMSDDGHVFRTC